MAMALFLIKLNLIEFAVFEKRLTHGRTDGRADKASYRVAFHNLKCLNEPGAEWDKQGRIGTPG